MSKHKKIGLTDKETLLKTYYGKTKGLQVRLRTWQKYGTNPVVLDSWIIDLLKIKKNSQSNYLDVGCGTGELVRKVTAGHRKMTGFGCDISPAMVKLTQHKNPKIKNNIVVASIEHLPYQSDFFDYVTAVHIFHHVPDIRKGLIDCARVLKKNGILLVVTANYELEKGLNHLHYEAMKELSFPKFMRERKDYLRFSGLQAEKHLAKAGFKYTKYIYRNNVCFKNFVPALTYYESAMMFRNSTGITDKRIAPEQWLALKNLIREKIKAVIKKKGSFVVPGEVYGLRIVKKYEV